MQFGFGILKLPSQQFWAMTPRELQAAFAAQQAGRGSTAPLDRSRFEDLVRHYPDDQGDVDG